jgi:hypothetical protein
VKQVTQDAITDVRTRMASGDRTVKSRSGVLGRSLTAKVVRQQQVIHASVTSEVIYARIQEYGGTIVPKNAKALTIPMGIHKYSGVRARDVPGLFVYRSKRTGQGYLVTKVGGRLEFWFRFAQSVTIPARLGMRATLRKFLLGNNSNLGLRVRQALRAEVARG